MALVVALPSEMLRMGQQETVDSQEMLAKIDVSKGFALLSEQREQSPQYHWGA